MSLRASSTKGEEAPVESSRFGKRFGRVIAIVLLVLAVLVAIATFAGSGGQSVSEPVPSSNPFK